jgi:hypothetical protein
MVFRSSTSEAPLCDVVPLCGTALLNTNHTFEMLITAVIRHRAMAVVCMQSAPLDSAHRADTSSQVPDISHCHHFAGVWITTAGHLRCASSSGMSTNVFICCVLNRKVGPATREYSTCRRPGPSTSAAPHSVAPRVTHYITVQSYGGTLLNCGLSGLVAAGAGTSARRHGSQAKP